MDAELLYQRTPVWMQHAIVSFMGWRINRKRYDDRFRKILKEYESRASWTTEELAQYRDARIRSFILHCEEKVAYYSKLFRKVGIAAKDIRGLADLAALPILEKRTVQERPEDFVVKNIPAVERVIAHTSGTTGSGLRFATTQEALAEQWAVWWRYRRTHGITLDTWCGYFGGRSVVPLRQTSPPFWRINYPARQIMFSAYHMTSERIYDYLRELRKRQPPWLHGYPSLLTLLASRILDGHTTLAYQPNWITTGAENLLPQQSDLIEQAFGVRPLQHYGLAEGVANISEGTDGLLRVDEDFSAVEFLPNPHGEGVKLIGTNFTNLATPLLRYDTGDLANFEDAQEGSLRGGRVVRKIDGRQEDYIVLRNGARLGRMDHVFKDMTSIREAQLYQREPGAIVVRIVRQGNYGANDEQQLLQEFRKRVGDDTEVSIEYHDALPRSATGKLRFVVSDLVEGKADAL